MSASRHSEIHAALFNSLPVEAQNGWILNGIDDGLRVWQKTVDICGVSSEIRASQAILPEKTLDVLSKVCSFSHIGNWNQLITKSARASPDSASEAHLGDINLEGTVCREAVVSQRRCQWRGKGEEEIKGERFYCYQNETTCWLSEIYTNWLTSLWHIQSYKSNPKGSLATLIFLADSSFPVLQTPAHQLASFKDFLGIHHFTHDSPKQHQARNLERRDSAPEGSRRVKFFGFDDSGQFESLTAPGATSVALFEKDTPGIEVFEIDQSALEAEKEIEKDYQLEMRAKYESLCRESAERVLETWRQAITLDGWQHIGTIESVEVVQSKSQSPFEQYPDEGLTSCVLCSASNVEVPLTFAVEYLKEPGNQSQWNGFFDSAEVIEDVSESADVKIVHTWFKPSWPVPGQDYCLLTGTHEMEDGIVVVSERSIAHADCPEDLDFRRSLRLDCGFVVEGNGASCNIHSVNRLSRKADSELDVIPSEPHGLAYLRDNLRKLFDTLPTYSRETYGNALKQPSSLDVRPSPSPSISSMASIPETETDITEPMNDRRIVHVTREQTKIDYRTLGNEVASRLLKEVIEVKEVVRTSSNVSASSWKKYHKEKEIAIFRKIIPGRTVISFLGLGYLDASVDSVWQILRNPMSRRDFDPMTKDITILEQISARISIASLVMEAKHCLMKQQRDMCVLTYEKSIGDRKFIAYRSVDHEGCPARKGIGRVKVFNAGWVIEPVESNGKKFTRAYYLIQVDPDRLPTVLVNYVSKRQPLIIASLRDFIASKQDASIC